MTPAARTSGAAATPDGFLLDTDAVVDVLRGRHNVTAQLAAHSPDAIAVSAVTVAELYYGARNSSDPPRNRREADRFLEQIRVIAFGRRAAAVHAELRFALRATPIGPHDLLIAATAIAASAVLVSANTREFARVPGLALVDWR